MDPTDSMDERQLLSILADKTTVEKLLAKYKTLPCLAEASFGELSKKIGKTEAIKIRAAFALSEVLAHPDSTPISSPRMLVDRFRRDVGFLEPRDIFLAQLDGQRRCIEIDHIVGSFNLGQELAALPPGSTAVSLITCHLWQDTTPTSLEELFLGHLIREAERFKISVMDHIVISVNWEFHSCRQEGGGQWKNAPAYDLG